jgi:hypothetical protein
MSHVRAPSLWLAAGMATMHLPAAAQPATVNPERPWYVTVEQEVEYRTNALNGPDGTEVSDTVFTTTLGGGVNARFGRQRAYARGTLSYAKYADISGIDSSGYNVDTGLDWQTVGNLSGNVSAGAGRRQADFNTGISTLILKNTEKYEELRARAQWGGVGLFGVEATAGWRRVGFSAPEFASREYEQGSGSAGVLYRPSSALTLGTGVAFQANDYDVPTFGQTQPESNERRDVYLQADWQATGASTFGGRVNFSKIDYDRANADDFSGVTGQVYWRWRPTGRTSVATSFSRDTGQESGFQRLLVGDRARLTATDFSRITNQFGVSATYDLTGKIVLIGNLSYERRSLVDTLTNGKGRDNTTLATLRADWAVTRVVTVGCEVGHETRTSSGFGSYDYSGSHVGCLGRVTLD